MCIRDSMWNNDCQNEVQGITMVGLAPDILTNLLTLTDGSQLSVLKYLVSHKSILSMDLTYLSNTTGRYIFIVKKSMFPEAKRFIQEFCTTHFYTMFPTTQHEMTTRQVSSHSRTSTKQPLSAGQSRHASTFCVNSSNKWKVNKPTNQTSP